MSEDVAVQLAKIAAHESWARTRDRSARTAPARRANLDAIARTVDPDGVMSEADRAKAVENAISAHYRRMALKSHAARRQAR